LPVNTERLIQALEQRAEREGALPLLLNFYRELLEVQLAAEMAFPTPESHLDTEAIAARAQHSQPLLDYSELKLDRELLHETFDRVKVVFAEFPDLFNLEARVARDLSPEVLLTGETLEAWFRRGEVPISDVTENLNPHLVENIIRSSLKPFLLAYAKVLLPGVQMERWWHGYCPVCGGAADYAYLDKERGSRWLVCSRCDSEWLYPRLECPYCDNKNQHLLNYYPSETGPHRLYTCEKCHQYLKATDLRQQKAAFYPPLERLLTLDMDRQGAELGYQPGNRKPYAGPA
jgi:FdhE protein